MLTTNLATTRLAELLDRACTDLDATRRLLGAAVARLDDSEPGYPGGGSGGSSGDSDGPLRSTVILRDEALRDRELLEQRLRKLELDARMVLRIVQKWGVRSYGNGEGVDERSKLCDSCNYNDRLDDRRVCSWCQRTLKAINEIRGGLGRTPLARLPQPALDHVRNGRMRRVTPTDLDRWARGDGRQR